MGTDRKKINNNIKFYTFIEIVKKYSDKDVSLSIKEINNHMKNKLGVVLDRRTIYGYIKDMKQLGFDVSAYDKERDGYYFDVHELENYEIRILSDAVMTSNFITKKKTLELIDKLNNFSSVYHKKDSMRKIFIEEISKSTNEQIFSNMTEIDDAIATSKKIKFNYCNYDCHKNLVYRTDNNGQAKIYTTSPVYMVLRKKNYYLVCADEETKTLKNYRVDRMLNVEVIEEESIALDEIKETKEGFNPAEYLRLTFKMYNGESDFIIIEFNENLFNYFLDTFGDFIFIAEKGNIDNNNLQKEIDMDRVNYQILEKVLGPKQYNNNIISGHYIEDAEVRGIVDDFSKKIKEIISSVQESSERYADTCGDLSSCGNDLIDDETEKRYIGVFKAKKGAGLVKWLMQLCSDVVVLYPESLREAIVEEICELGRIYL